LSHTLKLNRPLTWTVTQMLISFVSATHSWAQSTETSNSVSAQAGAWHGGQAAYAESPKPETSQFDFMIGDWDIAAKKYDPSTGSVVSVIKAWQHVKYLGDKRMVFDEWTGYALATGEVVTHGVTLRTYSPDAGQWKNVFLRSYDQDQPVFLLLDWKGNEMSGEAQLADAGIRFLSRFHTIKKDSYEWEGKVSLDDGKTWLLVSTQSARRQKK